MVLPEEAILLGGCYRWLTSSGVRRLDKFSGIARTNPIFFSWPDFRKAFGTLKLSQKPGTFRHLTTWLDFVRRRRSGRAQGLTQSRGDAKPDAKRFTDMREPVGVENNGGDHFSRVLLRLIAASPPFTLSIPETECVEWVARGRPEDVNSYATML
jgi:hypothetical protein